MSEGGGELLTRMLEALAQTDDDGDVLVSADDVAHFIPWVLVNYDVDVDALDASVVSLFAERCGEAGVTEDMTPEAVRAAFDAFYQAHPPSPALVAVLRQKPAVPGVQSADAPAADPLARFSGDKRAVGVLGGGERPAGAVPAGMVRMTDLHKKK